MKGVVLAGGLGKRLYPLTKVTNKHLLPVYNKPMVYYPLLSLADAGVEDVIIVTGGSSAGDFLRLLGSGNELGLRLNYTYQEGEGGIAEALGLVRHFIGKDRFVVILGDNIIEKGIKSAVENFMLQKKGARILLKEVEHPERFGVAELKEGRVMKIVEKPAHPESNCIVTGIYMYESDVFEIIDGLVPSGRGELEITDVNNEYIKRGTMAYEILEGWWTDAGTFDSLLKANELVANALPNKE